MMEQLLEVHVEYKKMCILGKIFFQSIPHGGTEYCFIDVNDLNTGKSNKSVA